MRKFFIGLAFLGVIGIFASCYASANRVVAASLPIVDVDAITLVDGAEAESPAWPVNNPQPLQKSASSLCDAGTSLIYPSPGSPPIVQTWAKADALAGRIATDCTKWLPNNLNLTIALAGSFRYDGSATGLLKRFGKPSSLRGIRYWSTSDKRWQILITDAAAIRGPEGGARTDFTLDELKSGATLYFSQKDNRSSKPMIYSMQIDASMPKKMIIRVTNTSSLYFLAIPILKPGDIQSTYILGQLSPKVWGYLNLLSIGNGWGAPPSGSQKDSWINRAVALYGHFTGVQVEKMPPLVRVGEK